MPPIKSATRFMSKRKKAKGSKNIYRMVRKAFLGLVENKYHDVFIENTVTNQTGNYHNLTGTVQGSSDITRNGDKITAIALNVQLYITANLVSTVPVEGRILIWMYRSSNTVAPGLNYPFQDSSTVGAKLTTPYHHDNGKNFIVLRDFRYSLPAQFDGTIALGSEGRARFIKARIPFKKGLKLAYVNSGSEGYNQIYLTHFSTLNTNYPLLTIYSRLIFKDA